MGYSLIPLVVTIVLVCRHVFASDASVLSKVMVCVVLALSLVCYFWLRRYSLVGLFLLVALGVFLLVYRLYQKARSVDRQG